MQTPVKRWKMCSTRVGLISTLVCFVLSMLSLMAGPLAEPLLGLASEPIMVQLGWLGITFPIVAPLASIFWLKTPNWVVRVALVVGGFVLSVVAVFFTIVFAYHIRIRMGYSI